MATPIRYSARAQIAEALAADLLTLDGNASAQSLTYLEADTASEWIKASIAESGTGFTDGVYVAADALGSVDDTGRARALYNRVALAPLADLTLDDAVALRDLMRAALIEYARADIVRFMERNGTLGEIARDMDAANRCVSFGDVA
jgi:hypothetical protein